VNALIVDDEPSVRLLLSRILHREVACDVTEATNGIEALDMLERRHYDFIVIDVMMPVMNGLETLEAIRRSPDIQHLPVMVLSAVRDEDQVRKMVSLGVSAYLTKPLRPSDASARIQRFVASLGSSAHVPALGQRRTLLGLPDKARLLVVDGDADFRQFVTSTLGQQYTVTEAESGAQGLRACLETRPSAILLGQGLGAVPAPMFLRKLRTLPGLATVPVVVAGSRGSDEALPEADATIQRTFVPEAFSSQFARLVTGGSPAQRVLLLRPELRPQMISAIEQVFGMLLGIEVLAESSEPDVPGGGADLVCVPISLSSEDGDLEFGIVTAREMSERLAALFLQDADVVTGSDVAAKLQDLASIISGRLQNALSARGDVVALGAPRVSALGDGAALADSWAGVGFASACKDVRFVAYVRPLVRAAAAVPAEVDMAV
jgi:CheY-like chemotaxis protein